MPSFSKLAVAAYVFALAVSPAMSDTYMQSPRGSNNRACRNDNNTNRRNGNRLFDSQNNDKGGYSCPRAYPFACYTPNNCNDNAQATANKQGGLTARNNQNANANAQLTNTAKQYYYEGSVLPVEWTNQHGCGTNTKLRCSMIIQYACEDTLTDTVNGAQVGPRDGTPVTNNSGNNRDDEASDTIPTNRNQQNDYRYGRHETLASYQRCANTARNANLWTADQNLNGDTARFSRQNPNGNRNGLECPEESEYYPYWGVSPFKDLAILTDNIADCPAIVAESQNTKARQQCQGNVNGDIPITEAGCTAKGGTWATVAPFNVPAPTCALGPWTRDNHLGNAGVGVVPGQQSGWNMTIPKDMVGKQNCVIRLRYNMTSSDTTQQARLDANAKEVPVLGDKTDNGAIADRNNNEQASYKAYNNYQLGTAVNTNQYGRTFQDRTHVFAVKPAPTTGTCAGKAIYNLNVRGKRGNIVQTYPSTEYDFVPNVLTVETEDCVHVAFFGSDYNPNRNPNNGEGGPPNPNNENEAKADRSNIVPMEFERTNFPVKTGEAEVVSKKMFDADVNAFSKLAFLDQPIGTGACQTIQQIKQTNNGATNNREARERYSRNCAKLSGQKTPAFDGGLLKAGNTGNHAYISSRNNNLSNRGQKALMTVVAKGAIGSAPNKLPSNANNDFGNAGNYEQGPGQGGTAAGVNAPTGGSNNVVLGAGIGGGLLAVGAAFVAYRKMNNGAAAGGAMTPMAAGAGQSVVTARYAHNAKEAGELSFQKGESITVLRQDASGWWEGQTASGARGVFPSNYVQ